MSLQPWQQALISGVSNMHVDASGSPTGGEPFTSAQHRGWLFGDVSGQKHLKTSNRADMQAAVARVPKKGGGTWNNSPQGNDADEVLRIIEYITNCGGMKTNNLAAQPLYECIDKKIIHAEQHGLLDGKLKMARAIYKNAIGDCKATVIQYGSVEFFGKSGYEAQFETMLNQEDNSESEEVFEEIISHKMLEETSHDW